VRIDEKNVTVASKMISIGFPIYMAVGLTFVKKISASLTFKNLYWNNDIAFSFFTAR
jgi:hypothetical protein